MPWQDIVLSAVGVIFVISLLPQVIHGFKEKVGPIKYLTSVPTFLALYVTAATYLSLHLYFSALTVFLTGTAWLILCIQRALYHKK